MTRYTRIETAPPDTRYEFRAGVEAGADLVLAAKRAEAYVYHPTLDYLIKYDYQDAGSAAKTVMWSYDAGGNRTYASDKPGAWSYDALNRMTYSPYGAYTHDMAGNRTSEPSCVNGWDEVNRLSTISSSISGYSNAWFDYRADGMRVREYYQAVGGGGAARAGGESVDLDGGAGTNRAVFGELYRERLHRYDGQMPMEVVTREGVNWTTTSVKRHALGARGIDRVEAWTPSSGTDVSYPVYDGHGNMIQALRRSQFGGGVPASMPAGGRTDPWGVYNGPRSTPAATYCANLGQPTDAETGLVYMRARYYEPWTGRFISEDPAMDGANWYVYCDNGPTGKSDTTGCYPGKIEDNLIASSEAAAIDAAEAGVAMIVRGKATELALFIQSKYFAMGAVLSGHGLSKAGEFMWNFTYKGQEYIFRFSIEDKLLKVNTWGFRGGALVRLTYHNKLEKFVSEFLEWCGSEGF